MAKVPFQRIIVTLRRTRGQHLLSVSHISCRTQVLLRMWLWKFLLPAPHPSYRSAWQSTNTVGAGRRGWQELEQDLRDSPLLSGTWSRQALWEPVCPSSVTWGSLQTSAPSQCQSLQGDRQTSSLKKEAMINHLRLGLQGRFQGNDNAGHCDSPKGTCVIFSAPC